MRDLLRDDFTFTKRHLGAALLVGGVLLAVAMLLAEWLDADSGGFGLVQQIGTAFGLLAAVLGATLLPLGDQPV